MQRPPATAEAMICFAIGVGVSITASVALRAIGDERPRSAEAATPVAVVTPPAPAPAPSDDDELALPAADPLPTYAEVATSDAPHGAELGRYKFTRYYVVDETRYEPSGEVTIYDDRACKPIATGSRDFVRALDMEGTGRLRDGRTINVSADCGCGHSPCYRTAGADERWGIGARGEPLEPFRTVAVDPDVVPLGTHLYIPELDGLTMPGPAPTGGYVHDGCVVAVDVGGRVRGRQLDFFVGRKVHSDAFDARYELDRVTVYRGGERCEHPGAGHARPSGT
jgi:3D (Asp-Asp-Asp) domain-containing protein